MSLKKRIGASRRRLAGLASSLDGVDRQLGSHEEGRSTDFLLGLCLLAPLSFLAEALLLKTHHRPLGAATFASIALIAWVGLGLLLRTLTPASASASAEGTVQERAATGATPERMAPARMGAARMSLWAFGFLASGSVFVRALLG